ncbi:MAG: TRAP transporter TatT component family protein [Acidobacteria bacterium]|nr:TRAP transporter TatT component family protein [Acidobacteriota bacterium]
MQKVFILIILLGFSYSPALSQSKSRAGNASSAAASVNPFHEVDSLMTFGEDNERDKQSLEIAEKALSSDGNNYQWLWRVARACYFVGDNVAKADKLRYFERGIDVGERATAQLPDAVEGHFWLAVNYGGYAEQKGVFKALRTVKKIRAEMETVLRLNDRYQNGGAYHALGEMDRELPRLFGGNLQRSISRLEQGVGIAPDNLEMKFVLARAYQDAKRKEDARRQLQDIIGRPVNHSRAKADRNVQEKARRMLDELGSR